MIEVCQSNRGRLNISLNSAYQLQIQELLLEYNKTLYINMLGQRGKITRILGNKRGILTMVLSFTNLCHIGYFTSLDLLSLSFYEWRYNSWD